jgi:hypothetical protein
MPAASLTPCAPRVRVVDWRFAAFVPALLAGCGTADAFPGTNGVSAAGASGGWAGERASASGSSGSAGTGGRASSSAQGGRVTTGSGGTSGGAGRSNVGGDSSLAGQGGLALPPEPGPDGRSPYERECHGDTAMCEDVAALRCLGIRVDATVHGYSCSNVCETDADCSDAASSAESNAACVDFVTQKHCLLVCLRGDERLSCPAGMGCYVYPESPIGYCLWQ